MSNEKALLVKAERQLWEVNSSLLSPEALRVSLIHLEIVSVEAGLCGLPNIMIECFIVSS